MRSAMQLQQKDKSFSPYVDEIKHIYFLFVRSLLEQSATVWHSSLTEEKHHDLEQIQNLAFRVILEKLDMESLTERRRQLCLNFLIKCRKNPNSSDMFPENKKVHRMKKRNPERYKVEHANTARF